HDCSERDPRFFDRGFENKPGANDLVCGEYGTPQFPEFADTPAGITADREVFRRQVVPLRGDAITDNREAYAGQVCVCKSTAPPGYTTQGHGKMVCARSCATLKGCSGHGECIAAEWYGSVDRVCRCAPGWGGDDCSREQLRDHIGQVCGGADRGVIAYVPNKHRLEQACVCVGGYVLREGICSRPAPKGFDPVTGALTACTSERYGTVVPDLQTLNDELCSCQPGRAGAACEQTLGPAYQGPSGVLYLCTDNGEVDPVTGLCVCREGFVGTACEVDATGIDCGTGTPYRDNALAGVQLIASTGGVAVVVGGAAAPLTHGRFDGARYWRANPDVLAAEQPAELHWALYGSGEGREAWLADGAHGLFNPAAYTAVYDMAAYALTDYRANYATREVYITGARGAFDEAAYLLAYPDLATATIPLVQHWALYGSGEGREAWLVGGAHGLFDPVAYAAAYGTLYALDDYRANLGRRDVYIAPGAPLTHGAFDGARYWRANPDVEAARSPPAWHWALYGSSEAGHENRDAWLADGSHGPFDKVAYAAAYAAYAVTQATAYADYVANYASGARDVYIAPR
ncbi:MAG: hypothetical protein Q7V62_13110, partial [Actinomycetota bacterium]|nr:hypothetical protein [Actinomycetota bacterium]